MKTLYVYKLKYEQLILRTSTQGTLPYALVRKWNFTCYTARQVIILSGVVENFNSTIKPGDIFCDRRIRSANCSETELLNSYLSWAPPPALAQATKYFCNYIPPTGFQISAIRGRQMGRPS